MVIQTVLIGKKLTVALITLKNITRNTHVLGDLSGRPQSNKLAKKFDNTEELVQTQEKQSLICNFYSRHLLLISLMSKLIPHHSVNWNFKKICQHCEIYNNILMDADRKTPCKPHLLYFDIEAIVELNQHIVGLHQIF